MKGVALVFISIMLLSCLQARDIRIQKPISGEHPRYLGRNITKASIQKMIAEEEWAREVFDKTKQSIEPYVNRHQTNPEWIVSRLQMYWKTKSDAVFIKGGVYDHAEGEAPVPTVKFPGTRDNVSVYAAPMLDSILPYMDDPRGVYLVNKSRPGQPMEWADISKTGRIIESINTQIMGMAYNAAVLYWLTDEEKYAKFASGLFNTYMQGMNYRKEPFDLSYGHHQTLAGLSTFEVIQEVSILNNLTGIYDYLYSYLQKNAAGDMPVYTSVFKKWADIQVAHGVAFNNWNLMQAKNILNIALMLDDDKTYADGKGNQYYTNYILNKSSQRQWSLQKVVNEGYDQVTGLWNESPGYSLGVLNDVVGFVSFFDKYYHLDLVKQLPVLEKAVLVVAQYLFPNGYHASFGDSHYGKLNLAAAYQMVANARANKKPGQDTLFTRYIKAMQQFYKERGMEVESREGRARSLNAILYADEKPALDDNITAGKIQEFVTPVLYSSHVSYLALRNGWHEKNGLMAVMSGSKGNHMHAGGISMELYGKGYVMAPESGIGTSYFQQDYAEYYSQFPAHNTVAVDGISAYPVMKSNHGFDLVSSYPASGAINNHFSPVSFADLYFLEPETQADQKRLTSIIRTSDTTGYYLDIFRSKRKDGKDKMHDYFYHNIGQQLLVNDNNGKALPMQPTEKLSFGGGHLFAYDYLYDKKSIVTDKDINAVFELAVPGKEKVQMHLWMKGEKEREIFAVKSPKSRAIDRMGLPNEVVELPMPTIVARQSGEAWKRPFLAVYEATAGSENKNIRNITPLVPAGARKEDAALKIESKTFTQYVFSSPDFSGKLTTDDKSFNGSFGVVSEQEGKLDYLFLGAGKRIAKGAFQIVANETQASAALVKKAGVFYFTASAPVTLSVPVTQVKGNVLTFKSGGGSQTVIGKKEKRDGMAVWSFTLPAMGYVPVQFR